MITLPVSSTQIDTSEVSAGALSPLLILIDEVRTSAPDHHGCLSGWQWEFIRGKLLRAGIDPSLVRVELADNLADVEILPIGQIIIGLGEKTLRRLTEKRGIDKWVLSPLHLRGGGLLLPAYDLGRIQKDFTLGVYLETAFHRAREFTHRFPTAPVERFLLNPTLEETYAVLERLRHAPEVAVDVETGYGQINTVGFAWSPSDAIAINVLPDRGGDSTFFELWSRIRDVLESPGRKIFQNFIYDTSYFSAYGIRVKGEIFDTMHAMKVLWPELDMGLGNVGRFYTRRPYWKDDGKIEGEEGKKKDWGNVRDWPRHYLYNCRDTSGTFEASRGQIADLKARGLERFYFDYLMKMTDGVREMCAEGFPLCGETRERLQRDGEALIERLTREFHTSVGEELNPRSPKQMQGYLRSRGVKLPKKYDKATGLYKETSDASAIKKIRLKHPEMKELALLQEIKSLDKALSSYVNFEPRPDGRLTYSLNLTGTETLRWSGNKDPWDRGFNIQTIPREGGEISIKSMFLAPEGWTFLECDLRQAESRFVAYDSGDKTLIDMLESNADVHTYVGKAIMKQKGLDPESLSKEEFKATWRQLGKKAGHGLNYGMKARVFQETVFNELDMVISTKDAELITQAYFGLFPGIPRWHRWVKNELYTKRKLSAPSGWERYFYGRLEDALKEALAWRPQHTIPWITNHLMLYLSEERKQGRLEFRLLSQVHDALYLLVRDDWVERVAKVCLDHMKWHPSVTLPGGTMYIPTEVSVGKRLSEKKEF